MSVVGTVARVRGLKPLNLGRLLQYGLAVASIGGGLIHISAARDHSSEPVEMALFLAAALGQLVWAGVVLRNVSGWTLGVGGILSVVLVACWALSRTTGLPILRGGVEPVGFKDGIAVLLEFAVAAGVGLLAVLPPPGRAMLVPAGRLAFHTAAVSVAALTVTAMVIAPAHPGGGHSDAELAARQPGGPTESPRGADHADEHETPANVAGGGAPEAPHRNDSAGTSGSAAAPGADGRRGAAGHDEPAGHDQPAGHGAKPGAAVPGETTPGDRSEASTAASNGGDGHSAHGVSEDRGGATEGPPATDDHSAHGAMPADQGSPAPRPITSAPEQSQPPAHHTTPPPEQSQPPAHHTTPPPEQGQSPPAAQNPPTESTAPTPAPESQPPPATEEDRSPAWMGRTSDQECEDARNYDPGFYERYCRGSDGRYRSG